MINARLFGFLLALIGAWMWWNAWGSISYQLSADVPAGIIFDPAFSLRLIAASAALIGGLFALIRWRVGQWLSGLAFILIGLLTSLMIGMGTDRSLWSDELALSFAIGALYLGLVIARDRTD